MRDQSPFPDLPGPRAARVPQAETHHGLHRTDEYGWLRAENWQEVLADPARLAPAIRDHLLAENVHQARLMAGTEELQRELVAEMRGRVREDEASVPRPDGPYAYGWAYAVGGQHRRVVRVPREGGEARVLLDGDREAEGKAFFQLGGTAHSRDHRHLAWASDDQGSERFTVRVRDLATGRDLPDRMADTAGVVVWTADGAGVVTVGVDAHHRPCRVVHHVLGTPAEADRVLHEEADPGLFVEVGATRDGCWIVLGVGDHASGERRLVPATDPGAAPVVVEPRAPGLLYEVEGGGDELFVLTNADGARDFKVMAAPADGAGREGWVEVVPHVPGRLILAVHAYRRHLVRIEREGGLPRIVVRDRRTGAEHAVAFDEEAYDLDLVGGHEYDAGTVRFVYSSPTIPDRLYAYDMATRERVLLKAREVPSGHAPSDYVARRLTAPSDDGALVPVTLLHRRDTALDGSAPCLLTGYGAYGYAFDAGFETDRLSLVDRGWVYAIAHVRGGKDKGYAWYEDGKLARKENSFRDFVAVARHLVAEGVTARDRLVAQGGSAGGMLVAAAVNMAPEAFAGVVAQVPFVDVLATMLDASLPLTPPERTEWGDPITSEEAYRRLAGYSPYDNVGAGPYPPILATAGLTDPRVTYWEPAKWVARLRDRAAGGPFLLRVEMGAGHGGAPGRFARLEEVAHAQAFALRAAGRA